MRAALVVLLYALSGCVRLPPYDGGAALAHPTMTTDAVDTDMARRVGERSECTMRGAAQNSDR